MVNTITLQKVHDDSIVDLFGNIYVKLYYIIVSVNKVRVHLRNETVPAVQQICREEVAL